MAHITNCDTCGRRIVDRSRCEECKKAVPIDLLYRIQKFLLSLKGRKKPLSKKLIEEILNGKFQSLKQTEKVRRKSVELSMKKSIYDGRRTDFIQRAVQEFEMEHPDPWPTRY